MENGSTPLENSRWEKFCLKLLEGLNQTQAYIAAGYAAKGDSAIQNAARLITNIKVSTRLAWLKTKSASETIMSRFEMLELLSEAARGKGSAAVMTKEGLDTMPPDWNSRLKAMKQIALLEGWEKQQQAVADSGLKELSKHFAGMREKRGADAVDTD